MPGLLIYPFGGSDLQLPGERPPRQAPLAERVDALLAHGDIECRLRDGGQRTLELLAGGQVRASMPILGETLAFVAGEAGPEITLQPILTAQAPASPQDTAPLERLLAAIAARAGLPFRLRVLAPWLIKRSPFDYGAMVALFEREFMRLYEFLPAVEYGKRFYQVAPGTPAMSFASRAFARDPQLSFVYTPMQAGAVMMPHFEKERRAATDAMVETLARRLDWGALVLLLQAPGNGYTPLVGPHPLADRVELARALECWTRREYAKAADGFEAVVVASTDGLEVAAKTAAQHCRAIASMRELMTASNAAAVATCWDAGERMLASSALEDLSGLLLAAYAWNDAFLTWGLRRVVPGDKRLALDPDQVARVKKERQSFGNDLKREHDKLMALSVLLQGEDAKCLKAHGVFQRTLSHLDPIRNNLVHGTTNLAAELLKERLTGLLIQHCADARLQLMAVTWHVMGMAAGLDDSFQELQKTRYPLALLANSLGANLKPPALSLAGGVFNDWRRALHERRTQARRQAAQ